MVSKKKLIEQTNSDNKITHQTPPWSTQYFSFLLHLFNDRQIDTALPFFLFCLFCPAIGILFGFRGRGEEGLSIVGRRHTIQFKNMYEIVLRASHSILWNGNRENKNRKKRIIMTYLNVKLICGVLGIWAKRSQRWLVMY